MDESEFRNTKSTRGFVSKIVVLRKNEMNGTSDREVTIGIYPGTRYIVTFAEKTDEWYDGHGIKLDHMMTYP